MLKRAILFCCSLLQAFAVAAESLEHKVSVSVWSSMTVSCKNEGQRLFTCTCAAFKTRFDIGFDSQTVNTKNSDYYAGMTATALLSAGLTLPLYLLTDIGTHNSIKEGEHRVVATHIDEVDYPSELSITVAIDGETVKQLITNDRGQFQIHLPRDSVVGFSAQYQKHALSLTSEIYIE